MQWSSCSSCQMCTRESLRPFLGGPSLARSTGPRSLLLRARPRMRYLSDLASRLAVSILPTGIPYTISQSLPLFSSRILVSASGDTLWSSPIHFSMLFTAGTAM